jgi:hypothetical protein
MVSYEYLGEKLEKTFFDDPSGHLVRQWGFSFSEKPHVVYFYQFFGGACITLPMPMNLDQRLYIMPRRTILLFPSS